MDGYHEMTELLTGETAMTKIQKTGIDGKVHDYWQYTPEEIAVMKQKARERKEKEDNNV